MQTSRETGFQKAQRPSKGSPLQQDGENLKAFRHQFQGRFRLEMTRVKGDKGNRDAVLFLKSVAKDLRLDVLSVIPLDAPFRKGPGNPEERQQENRTELESVL